MFQKYRSVSFPNLDSTRLRLTEIREGDVEALFSLFSNKDVVRYYDLEVFTEVEQANQLMGLFRSRYESTQGIRWGVRFKGNNNLIGTCGFNSWNEKMKKATIGYDLQPNYWGKGIATEAVHEMLKAGFSEILPCGPLHRIQADTIVGNAGSEGVLRKLRFKEEGIRRESIYIRGEYHDMKCFGLLKSEFVET